MYRRKDGYEYYVFPGGHMRIGEEPIQTAQREVFEETTIRISNIKPVFELKTPLGDKIAMDYYFIAKWESGDPILSGEESRESNEQNYYEPMWVNLDDIEGMNILPLYAKEWFLEHTKIL